MIDGEVTDDPAESRYEIRVDDELAGFIDYRARGDVLTMVHTEVAPEWEGRGVGTTLVARALDDVRRRGLQVRPLCPFVARYIDDHPDLRDLVAA